MPDARPKAMSDFRDVCFVIMPFGIKTVGKGDAAREIDFDPIYDRLFAPAISAVRLPDSEGGGHLRPVRTDREFHTAIINREMFEYLEYSRFALADITAINANVFYELGARHRAHGSGTAIFRQGDAAIPFDINQVKAFPYTVEPQENLETSREFVTKVLRDSLERNAWDSPIMLALRKQMEGPEALQDVLLKAENALRTERFEEAHECWLRAARIEPGNPLHDLKASNYPKLKGDWDAVIALMRSALTKEDALNGESTNPTYSEAYRELGIAENKRDIAENKRDIAEKRRDIAEKRRDIAEKRRDIAEKKRGKGTFPRSGEESLRRAVHLDPSDFDAWASLGGVLRRADDEPGALAAYEKSVEVSNGHPYPLLMMLKLRAKLSGEWTLDLETATMLGEAKGFRSAQVANDPPIDVPWSFFDLAEIQLYLRKPEEALAVANRGLELSTANWMPGTFLSALEMLPASDALSGLDALKAAARERHEELADD